MLSPTQDRALFGGDTWLSCHTDVLLTYFILTTRCQWQPIYPSKCIHKTYLLRNQVIHSDPTSRNKISNQPTTHILHILYSSRSSFWGRHGVLLWLYGRFGKGKRSEENWTEEGLRKRKKIHKWWAHICKGSLSLVFEAHLFELVDLVVASECFWEDWIIFFKM